MSERLRPIVVRLDAATLASLRRRATAEGRDPRELAALILARSLKRAAKAAKS